MAQFTTRWVGCCFPVRAPGKRLTIAFACNIQEIDRQPYIKRLYELLTDEPFEINVYTKDRIDQAIFTALKDSFNYGSLHFERTGKPFTTDKQELAQAFAYLNRVASRSTLETNYASTRQAITDGRHPVGGSAFLKAGSYIAMKLREKYGSGSIARYSATGTLPFFADYVTLYRADTQYPRELRLSPELEALSLKWNQDWSRTWNAYTQRLTITPDSDLDAIGGELRKSLAGADVRPDFVSPLCDIQDGIPTMKAAKLAVELYPESARANGNYGIYMLLGETTDERRAYFRQHLGGTEPALPYFKKSLALNPDGIAGTRVLSQIVTNWTNQNRLDDALVLLKECCRAASAGTGLPCRTRRNLPAARQERERRRGGATSADAEGGLRSGERVAQKAAAIGDRNIERLRQRGLLFGWVGMMRDAATVR